MATSLAHPAAPGGAASRPATDGPPGGRRLTPYLLLAPGIAWLAMFFVVPLIAMFGTSLQVAAPSGEIGAFVPALNWANYSDALQAYWPQFIRSFGYAAAATVGTLVIGYPVAYYIAQRAGRWRNLLLVLVVAPFFASFILRSIAWKRLLADDSVITSTLRGLHLIGAHTSIVPSQLAVIGGITYNFLPFMILPLYASLERIDPRLIEAGADLYGNALTVFRKVTVPLSLPGVVAGTLLTFIPATGDYVNADQNLLGNRDTSMIGNVVQSRYLKLADYPIASSLSFLLMLAILVLVFLYIRRAGTEELV